MAKQNNHTTFNKSAWQLTNSCAINREKLFHKIKFIRIDRYQHNLHPHDYPVTKSFEYYQKQDSKGEDQDQCLNKITSYLVGNKGYDHNFWNKKNIKNNTPKLQTSNNASQIFKTSQPFSPTSNHFFVRSYSPLRRHQQRISKSQNSNQSPKSHQKSRSLTKEKKKCLYPLKPNKIHECISLPGEKSHDKSTIGGKGSLRKQKKLQELINFRGKEAKQQEKQEKRMNKAINNLKVLSHKNLTLSKSINL